MAALKILPTQRFDLRYSKTPHLPLPRLLCLLCLLSHSLYTFPIQSSLCFSSPFVVTSGSVFLSSCSFRRCALYTEFYFTFYTSCFSSSLVFLPHNLLPPLSAPRRLLSFSNILLSSSYLPLCVLALSFTHTSSTSFCPKCLPVVNILLKSTFLSLSVSATLSLLNTSNTFLFSNFSSLHTQNFLSSI